MQLDSLNKVQKEVVLNSEGPMMVLAGAGSGKTRTLVTRISHLLQEKGISPFQVLALTFSNKAAREMRERIASSVDIDLGALQVTTFHSFCARVLRSQANYIGLSKSFTIYDDSESKAIVKNLLAKRGISTKEISPYEVLNFIDELKNKGYYPGRETQVDTEDDDFFFQMFQEYESELARSNAVDFGGLITGVLKLFEKHPTVLKTYQERFRYLLVDEYQDTNRCQFELVCYLAEHTQNICVVGDEDQSIYSWRGADINNIFDFEKKFPKAKMFKLEQNYRSSKKIIEAASHVIARNSYRKGKTMWTDNPDGEEIEIVETGSDKEECDFVASKIADLKKAGATYNDIAVFYRTNSQSRQVEDALRNSNTPYRVVGGIKFYDRKEIKDILAYLRLIVNEKDNLALSRVVNVPARGIGATTLRKFEEESVKNSQSLLETLRDVVNAPEDFKHIRMSAKVKSSINHFVSLIDELKILNDAGESPEAIFEKAVNETGYISFLKAAKTYEAQARLENLGELGNAITQFESNNPKPTLDAFLETVTLDQSANHEEQNSGEVSLMTIHGAKGLEFQYVFIVGAEENMFPSLRSLEGGEKSLEEERRLFYVAMTRAMVKLYICFAQGRMLYGQLRFNGPSRFIHEIPPKYYSWIKTKSGGRGGWAGQNNGYGSQNEDEFFADEEYDDDVVYQVQSKGPDSKFPQGVSVIHSLYGEGQVTETSGAGDQEKVVIKFKDGAIKKFMVKFAPLELLS
ncbi:MAG: ATP-dependent DNA helicase PcrA [Halobacteriovorax sp.]|nr:ATP-dependent DNA helicase PcrA [Halobacteriovorax sp.]|tara:strand:+ start:529984 stop:532218 length:2235 start_codon:yes stop_codon:yes gene_type:complete